MEKINIRKKLFFLVRLVAARRAILEDDKIVKRLCYNKALMATGRKMTTHQNDLLAQDIRPYLEGNQITYDMARHWDDDFASFLDDLHDSAWAELSLRQQKALLTHILNEKRNNNE